MAVRDYLSKKIKKNPSRDYTIGIIGEDGLKKALNSLKKLKIDTVGVILGFISVAR